MAARLPQKNCTPCEMAALTLKWSIVTICDCPVLLAFYNVGKVSYNWTNVRAIELKTERIKDLRLYAQLQVVI